MPAFCCHYLMFQEIKNKVKNKEGFKLYDKACSIGTQGPDIFFFSKPLKLIQPKRKIGSALHRTKPEKIFNSLCKYIQDNDNDIAKSYAYGMIMHYSLDRTCHPYIYALEKEVCKNQKIHHNSAHNKVEMALDSFMLHQKLGIDNPRNFNTSNTIKATEKEKNEIGNILAFVINDTTEYTITPKEIVTVINDLDRTQSILQDKTGIINAIFTILETILAPFISYFKFSVMIKPMDWKNGLKYLNEEHRLWHSPYFEEESRYESFEDLFNIACSDALKLINSFDNLLKGIGNSKEITNNISFLTGRSI